MQIKAILFRPNDTLLDDTYKMGEAHLGIAIVVDTEGRLIEM